MVNKETLWYFLYSCTNPILVFLHKSGSWDMGQNALGQSDCTIFELTVSLEQNDEKAWFCAYGCRFIEIKS